LLLGHANGYPNQCSGNSNVCYHYH